MAIKLNFSNKKMSMVAFFNVLGPVILNGVNFFTIPIFSRVLGAERYGQISIYLFWVSIFSILTGIQTLGSISIAKVHIDDEKQDEYYSSILGLSLISSLCWFFIFSIFSEPLSQFMGLDKPFMYLMLLQSFGSYCVTFMSTKFIQNKESHKNFFLSVVTTIITTILSLILVFMLTDPNKVLGRVIGMAIPYTLIGICILIYIFLKGKKIYNNEYWKFCLKLCLPLILHNLSHIVLGQSSKMIISHYLDDKTVGIYSLSVTFVSILNILWLALNNTWVPFYYEYRKKGDFNKIENMSRQYMNLFAVLVTGFILLSPEVFKLFANSEFWAGLSIVPVLAVGQFFVFLYSFPVNFQFYNKSTITISIGTVISACVNLLLNYLLVPNYGIMGGAIASLISYVLLLLFHHICAVFFIKDNYEFKLTKFVFSSSIVAVGVALYYLFEQNFIIRWGVGIILGFVFIYNFYRKNFKKIKIKNN